MTIMSHGSLGHESKFITLMKRYYIITYGCQSNISDSERIMTALSEKGYKKTSNKDEADLIIINSCSVRQSAVDRIYGQIRNIKKNTKKSIIVTGCLLKKDKKEISKIANFKNIEELLSLKKENYLEFKPSYQSSFSALIPIMSGCDNFCTYCVVPYVRGKEKSRPIKNIINEVQGLILKNYKEIWLLGQNVNSYKDKDKSFVYLLSLVNKIPGDFWIRFTSSHPKNFIKDEVVSWEKLVKLIKESPKITEYIHLPVQSGDDDILKKMNRPYNIKSYKDCINLIKKEIPDIGLSTDIIVGFPNESKKQFENTVSLFKECQFDMAYISKYSPRTETIAQSFYDNVSNQEKIKRKKILNDILEKNVLVKNKKLINKTLNVLVEKQKNDYLLGKTRNYKTVKFKGDKNLIGTFTKIKINKVTPWGLQGIIKN